jgi:hypothetical protein
LDAKLGKWEEGNSGNICFGTEETRVPFGALTPEVTSMASLVKAMDIFAVFYSDMRRIVS